MRRETISLVLLLAVLFTGSCDRPACRNTNQVFDRFAPHSREYKTELAKQIRSIGAEKLRYWFDAYGQQEGREYIVADIQGEGLCAKGEILVTDWSGIEGLRGTQPRGYHGAELSGLKLDIAETPGGVAFILKTLDRIID